MKIALCLYGMGAMDCLKHAKPHVQKDITRKHWLKYMIEPNDMDIFMHCWSPSQEQDYIDDFGTHLKNHQFEERKQWPTRRGHTRIVDYGNSLDEIMQSVHYSLKQSVEMKQQYEQEHDFEYDLVMLARMDIVWFDYGNHKLAELDLNPEFIYTSPWNYAFDKTKTRDMPPYIFDHYIVSGSSMINTISNLFDYVDKYVRFETPQVMKYQYFKDIGIMDKVQPNLFYRFYDHILFRWLYYPLDRHLYRKDKPITDEWKGLKEQRENLLKQILEE